MKRDLKFAVLSRQRIEMLGDRVDELNEQHGIIVIGSDTGCGTMMKSIALAISDFGPSPIVFDASINGVHPFPEMKPKIFKLTAQPIMETAKVTLNERKPHHQNKHVKYHTRKSKWKK